MNRTLAIMLTMTTYGTWLRGDARGWVDEGIVFPADPLLAAADRRRMKHPPLLFPRRQWLDVGRWIGESLIRRMNLSVYAMTVQSWHVHAVVSAARRPVAEIAKCAKDAARWGLKAGRPVWGDGYDKRFCFDVASVRARIAYVERHNVEVGLPARPWVFITPFLLSPP